MSWLARLFRSSGELSEDLVTRLRAWRRLLAADERTPFAEASFLVADVETTGLDARRDRLLAMGAVAVEGGRLLPGQGLDVTLRAPVASARANILVHGITPDAQTGGTAPDEALMEFLELARHDVSLTTDCCS